MSEFWVNLVPDKFSSFVGAVSLIIAFVCMGITFSDKQRAHATKLFAILMVVSLSFFASHWGTYFAAIFIVATAVTELDFLQNLAAIISKDKNYFDFKKEALTKDENIKRKAEEVVEAEFKETLKKQTTESKSEELTIQLDNLIDIPRSSLMRLSIDIEDKVLDYLSKLNPTIDKGVRISGKNGRIELDGAVFDSDGLKKVFEIKWTRNSKNIRFLIAQEIRKVKEQLPLLERITGSVPEYNLVIVVNEEKEINLSNWSKTLDRAKESKLNVTFLTLSDIGFVVGNSQGA